jgi:hypothetical protein
MNNVKTVALKTKNHLNRHKVAYAAGAVAIAAIALQQHNLKEFTKFLVEKGIDPAEYFNPEALAELNA